jgi:hypothetical protein
LANIFSPAQAGLAGEIFVAPEEDIAANGFYIFGKPPGGGSNGKYKKELLNPLHSITIRPLR